MAPAPENPHGGRSKRIEPDRPPSTRTELSAGTQRSSDCASGKPSPGWSELACPFPGKVRPISGVAPFPSIQRNAMTILVPAGEITWGQDEQRNARPSSRDPFPVQEVLGDFYPRGLRSPGRNQNSTYPNTFCIREGSQVRWGESSRWRTALRRVALRYPPMA